MHSDEKEALPPVGCLLTIIGIAVAYSIAEGILWIRALWQLGGG